jgi:hypothetical protein
MQAFIDKFRYSLHNLGLTPKEPHLCSHVSKPSTRWNLLRKSFKIPAASLSSPLPINLDLLCLESRMATTAMKLTNIS